MDKKIPVFPAVLTALAFLCFAAAYFVVTFCFVKPEYARGLLYGIPFAVLLGITLLSRFGRLSAMAASILACVLSVAFVIGAFLLSFYFMFTGNALTTKDLPHYERVLTRTTVKGCFGGVLPEHVPEHAENVYFFYEPQVLQGSETFTLAFTANAAALDAYRVKLEKHALWSGTYQQARDVDRNVSFPHVLRGKSAQGKIPDDYRFYQLSASPEIDIPNHGHACVVILNIETGEIVFQFEHW